MGEIKQAYIHELEQRLSDWWIEMEQLEARMKKVNVETEHKLFLELKQLRDKSDQTRTKLQELRDSEHPEWQQMQDEIDSAWQHLKQGLSSISERLLNK